MKKKIMIFASIASVLVVVIVGYYFSQNRNQNGIGINDKIVNEDNKQGNSKLDSTKTLVVYFSHGGNTQKLANEISKQIGGDFRRLNRLLHIQRKWIHC